MTEFDTMFITGAGLPADESFDLNDYSANNGSGTISPQELMMGGDDGYIMSNPPSSAFPNLSTPDSGYMESPAMASSGLNTSPMVNGSLDAELDLDPTKSFPLFPDSGYDQFAQTNDHLMRHNSSFTSVNSRSSAGASPMVRQKSSPGRPPTTYAHLRKHSETAGVAKLKPRKNLPNIEFNSEDDRETAKRKKNTAAARKSRQRKVEAVEALEAEIVRLRTMVKALGGNPDIDD